MKFSKCKILILFILLLLIVLKNKNYIEFTKYNFKVMDKFITKGNKTADAKVNSLSESNEEFDIGRNSLIIPVSVVIERNSLATCDIKRNSFITADGCSQMTYETNDDCNTNICCSERIFKEGDIGIISPIMPISRSIERNSLTTSDIERNSLITTNIENIKDISTIAGIKKMNGSVSESDIRRNSCITPYSSIERNSLTNSDIERNSLIATDGNHKMNLDFFNDSNGKMKWGNEEDDNEITSAMITTEGRTKTVVEEQLECKVSKEYEKHFKGCLYCLTKSLEGKDSHRFSNCKIKKKWMTDQKMERMLTNWITKTTPSGYIPSKDTNSWSDYAGGTSQLVEEESSRSNKQKPAVINTYKIISSMKHVKRWWFTKRTYLSRYIGILCVVLFHGIPDWNSRLQIF